MIFNKNYTKLGSFGVESEQHSKPLPDTRLDTGNIRQRKKKCPSPERALYMEETNKQNHYGCYGESDDRNKQGAVKGSHTGSTYFK